MLCMKKPQISYDPEFDILYYTIGDTSNSYGDEFVDNIVELKDFDTDEITGFTVMNFVKICKKQPPEYDTLSGLLDIQTAKKACGIR